MDFTVGVEEEYQLVDLETRALHSGVDDVLPGAHARVGDDVEAELQQSQIEIGTPVCNDLGEVRAELRRLRAEVASAAAAQGLALAAAGTHPFSRWQDNRITEKEAYVALADRYAHLAREQIVFGCHVHVAIGDQELAIQTMNQARPWLSPLLALSASSPFWQGTDTDYASYRTEVFGRWPTAGAPEAFASRAEFDRVVEELIATGSIDDRARLYWDVRPSARYETLEFRIADVCTSLDDAVMLAGLIGALVRRGAALAESGAPIPTVRPEMVRAATWRAARNGISADLVDVVGLRSAPARQVVDGLLAFVRPALDEWDEWDEVSALVAGVFERGTSAARQRELHRRTGSLSDVVDWIVAETQA